MVSEYDSRVNELAEEFCLPGPCVEEDMKIVCCLAVTMECLEFLVELQLVLLFSTAFQIKLRSCFESCVLVDVAHLLMGH